MPFFYQFFSVTKSLDGVNLYFQPSLTLCFQIRLNVGLVAHG